MNTTEFNINFDILYNNINSNGSPGLSTYEKSYFLTKAQMEIIKNYFTSVQGGNKYQQGIEDSAKRFTDFSTLIKVEYATTATNQTKNFDYRGKLFAYPSDYLLSISELVELYTQANITENSQNIGEPNKIFQVVPIKFDEYNRLMSKPSQEPLKRQVWKLSTAPITISNVKRTAVEIVPHTEDLKTITVTGTTTTETNNSFLLKVRYIKIPNPIILENLSTYGSDVQIDGVKVKTECELPDELHDEILQRAVELAKASYVNSDLNTTMTVGTKTE